MQQFIDDMIHMTEGEKIVHYWWLWLLIIAGSYIYLNFKSQKKK